MFRRKPRVMPSDARRELRDTSFALRDPSLGVLEIDYDPEVWTRMPQVGEDRTDWVARHLEAYATDLGLVSGSEEHAAAERAFNAAADIEVSHTADLFAMPHRELGGGSAIYVNALDPEMGVLEHGPGEDFIRMVDLFPDGPLPRMDWMPYRKYKDSWRMSNASSPRDVFTSDRVTRMFRETPAAGGSPILLYLSVFYTRPRGISQVILFANRTKLEQR